MAGHNIDGARAAAVARAYREGVHNQSLLAERFGLDRRTVAKILKANGLTGPVGDRGPEWRPEPAPTAGIPFGPMLMGPLTTPDPAIVPRPNLAPTVDTDNLLSRLRKSPMSLGQIAARIEDTEARAAEWLDHERAKGLNVVEGPGGWRIDRDMPPASAGGPVFTYESRADNTYVFGAMGDTHLGSRYERLDVLTDLYDRYAREGVDRVFHTGNWVDGECRLNKHSLKISGIDNQLQYLADVYPARPGIVTYAVSGDDHEGWWTHDIGVDPGKRAEQTMRDNGRADWVNLGFMEANVELVNANTGAKSILRVCHPGGGSSYAMSYKIQKIVESYEGGEKPAVGLYGHYHKLWNGNIRNVWVVQTGCCEDQYPFMRKNNLEAHVGGTLVKLAQDPRTGAIAEMGCTMLRYFNQGYYNDRWNPVGNPVLPRRGPA